MAGFEYRGQLDGNTGSPVTHRVLIANSSTVKVGDAVQMEAFSSGGGCKRAAAGTEILGIVNGIVDADGIDLDNTGTTIDGTWTSSAQTYAAASDNVTVAGVRAEVVVDKNSKFYNDSAGDLAAADEYKFFDLADQDQVANQNGSDTVGAMLLVERDPDGDGDASKGIFVIAESELDPYAQA